MSFTVIAFTFKIISFRFRSSFISTSLLSFASPSPVLSTCQFRSFGPIESTQSIDRFSKTDTLSSSILAHSFRILITDTI